eukprot:8413636-Pyramimonas_sp.AAC.1
MACRRWLRGPGRALISGVLKEEVRHLGPHVSMSQASSQEVIRRRQAARSAFYSLGSFWTSSLPEKFTRAIFLSLVQNSALCGLEAFLLTKQQRARLDAAIAHFAR